MNNLFMQKVIEDAQTVKNDIPVSALIVKNDEIICICHNQKEEKQNATYHAEILAIEQASKILNSWRLDECDMYVTLEPCPMCAGAIIQSRIKNLYFGSYDNLYGALGSKIDLRKIEFILVNKENSQRCAESSPGRRWILPLAVGQKRFPSARHQRIRLCGRGEHSLHDRVFPGVQRSRTGVPAEIYRRSAPSRRQLPRTDASPDSYDRALHRGARTV